MNDNEKCPLLLIMMPIALVAVPVLTFALCSGIASGGKHDLMLPIIMAGILTMSVLLMIGNIKTPEKSGTYKGIQYSFNTDLRTEKVCTTLSGIATVILFCEYAFMKTSGSKTTAICVTFLISLAVVVITLFAMHPHSTARTEKVNANVGGVITGLDCVSRQRLFISIGEDRLVFFEREQNIPVLFSNISSFQVILSNRNRKIHPKIDFGDTSDDVFRVHDSMLTLLNKLEITITTHDASATRKIYIDDVAAKQCECLRKLKGL